MMAGVLIVALVLLAAESGFCIWLLSVILPRMHRDSVRALTQSVIAITDSVRNIVNPPDNTPPAPFDQDAPRAEIPPYEPPWASWGPNVDLDPLPDPLADRPSAIRVPQLPDFTKLNQTDE